MQLDQTTIWIIAGAILLILLVIVVANARRKTAPRRPAGHDRDLDALTTTGDASVEIRLSRLADLRSKGLVTEEEYEGQRQKILGEL